MGTRRKGSKTDKNSSTSSNPLVQILHNKWRYYSRKHKSPPRVEVVIALIVVIFIALNYVGKLFHSGSEASASTCIDGLDAQGYSTFKNVVSCAEMSSFSDFQNNFWSKNRNFQK